MDEIWCQVKFDTLVSFDPNSYFNIELEEEMREKRIREFNLYKN
jgi:hypothetical protein